MPYLDSWEEWANSDYCFLTDKEIEVAMLFFNSQNIRSVALYLNRSSTTARNVLNRIRRKLTFGILEFKKWEQNKKEALYYPLSIPISCLKGPARLKSKLSCLGDSLDEILINYSEVELRKVVGIGDAAIYELREFLDQYGYEGLLRESLRQSFSQNLLGFELENEIQNFKSGSTEDFWFAVKNREKLLALSKKSPKNRKLPLRVPVCIKKKDAQFRYELH